MSEFARCHTLTHPTHMCTHAPCRGVCLPLAGTARYDRKEEPAVASILAELRHDHLDYPCWAPAGCRLGFSSVIPLNTDPARSKLWEQSKGMAAECLDKVSRRGTRPVVPIRPNTRDTYSASLPRCPCFHFAPRFVCRASARTFRRSFVFGMGIADVAGVVCLRRHRHQQVYTKVLTPTLPSLRVVLGCCADIGTWLRAPVRPDRPGPPAAKSASRPPSFQGPWWCWGLLRIIREFLRR